MKTVFLWSFLILPLAALDYKEDILPIFKEKCFDCHSDEARKIKGGLRLDDEEHFLKRFSRNEVVIPGDWDASYLFVTVVMPQEEKGAMPPKGKGKSLTEEEIRKVARWIHEGAKIDGKTGKKGPVEWDPEKLLKFKDGRIVAEQFGETPGEKEPKWETWKNNEGKEIQARFLGRDDEKVNFELKGGKKVAYPFEKLSKESQEKINVLSSDSRSKEE